MQSRRRSPDIPTAHELRPTDRQKLPRHLIDCPYEHCRINASQSARKFRYLARRHPEDRQRYAKLAGYWEMLQLAAAWKCSTLGKPVCPGAAARATFWNINPADLPANTEPPLPPGPNHIKPERLSAVDLQHWAQWCHANHDQPAAVA